MLVTTEQIYTFIISAVVMLAIDGTYLSQTGYLFTDMMAKIQRSPFKANLLGAVLAYLGLILAINIFILQQPKIPEKKKYILAFLLGFCIYIVYEGTSFALLKDWRPMLVVLDTIWGSILFLLTTVITVKLVKLIKAKTK